MSSMLTIILGKGLAQFQLTLPPRLLSKLREKAQERGIYVSEIIREALFEKYGSEMIDDARTAWRTLKKERRKRKD